MTHKQKQAILWLFNGHNISAIGSSGHRMRDKQHNVKVKIHPRTFYKLKRDLLKKDISGLFVLDWDKAAKFHGNSLVKKLYKLKNVEK